MFLISCLHKAASSTCASGMTLGVFLALILLPSHAYALQGKTPTGGAPHPMLRDSSTPPTPSPIRSQNGSSPTLK